MNDNILTDMRNWFEDRNGVLRWTQSPCASVLVGFIAGRRHDNGHIEVKFKNKPYMAHHIIWFLNHGEWPRRPVLHVNGNKSDNRLVNLRLK